MASSISGQDELNPALWLATQADKVALSSLFGTTRCVPQEKFHCKPYNNPSLIKLFQSKWLDIGLVLFCEFVDLDSVSVHKHAKKELGQYPAIFTEQACQQPIHVLYIKKIIIDAVFCMFLGRRFLLDVLWRLEESWFRIL